MTRVRRTRRKPGRKRGEINFQGMSSLKKFWACSWQPTKRDYYEETLAENRTLPEENLFWATLERAAFDLHGHCPDVKITYSSKDRSSASHNKIQATQREAREWFESESVAPFSFRWLVDALGLDYPYSEIYSKIAAAPLDTVSRKTAFIRLFGELKNGSSSSKK